MLHVFIDANIFLSFFLFTSDDLAELDKLLKLVVDKELAIHTNDHLKREIYRNRENKISEGLGDFRKHNFTPRFPSYSKDFPEHKEMISSLRKAAELHSELTKKIDKAITTKTLRADTLISRIFDLSLQLVVDKELYDAAAIRCEMGEPPGKRGSIGDAVHWEGLISGVPARNDLHIVSDDTDFRSELSEGNIKDYLLEEWRLRKRGEAFYYRSLSSFFKKHFPHINLAAEAEKDRTIDELIGAPNFSSTHGAIAKLDAFPFFTKGQIERIFFAVLNNTQVSWIASDPDVKAFLSKFKEVARSSIDKEKLEWVANMMELPPHYFEEEIPF